MEENHWPEYAAACRNLVRDNAPRFCELLRTEPISPITDEFLGQMFAVPVQTSDADRLKRHLFENYKVEVANNRHGHHSLLRYSINAFNSQDDLDRLYTALQETIDRTTLLQPGAGAFVTAP
jgi:isopenicillin-N epimerase